MGYMIKSDILNALKEDKEASLYLFRKNKKRRNVEEIIEFCYDSMGYVLDRLPQYRTDNVYEDAKDTNVLSEWVPCSERLPEHYVTVLAQHGKRFSDEQFIRPLVLTDEEEWYGDLGLLNSEVIAWMPLPDPYKGADK